MQTPSTLQEWAVYLALTAVVYVAGSRFGIPLSVPGLMALFGLGKPKTPTPTAPTDPLAPVDPTQPSQTPLLDLLRQLAANRRAVQAEVKRRQVEDDVLAKIEAIVESPNTEPR